MNHVELKNNNRLFLIFVSYNFYDTKKSLARLVKYYGEKISAVVIVKNNKLFEVNASHVRLHVIEGTNKLYEFSGYVEGFDYLNSLYELNSDDLFIVANDTIFIRRHWSLVTKYRVQKFVKNIHKINSRNIIYGQHDNADRLMCIDGTFFSRWISTYFFITDYTLMNKISASINEKYNVEEYVEFKNTKFSFKLNINSELDRHINNWLLGDGPGWYKKKNVTLDILLHKCVCVYLEFFTSALAEKNNYEFMDIYDGNYKLVKLYEIYIFAIKMKIKKFLSVGGFKSEVQHPLG